MWATAESTLFMAVKTALKYEIVAEKLRWQITTGQLLVGEKLPPIDELSRRFGFSRATTLRGVQQLATEGLVTANADARGTVVLNNQADAPLAATALACLLRPVKPRNPEDNFALDVINGVRAAISARDFRFFHHSLDETDYESRLMYLVRRKAVSGILLDQKTPLSTIRRLAGELPVAVFNRKLNVPNVPYSTPDYEHVGHETVRLFRERGYERIGFYYMPRDEAAWDEAKTAARDSLIRMRRAFFKAADAFGYRSQNVIAIPGAIGDAPQTLRAVCGLPQQRPADWKRTGILAVSERHAVRLIEALRDTDLSVPRDVGVVSGFWTEISSYATQTPSTWRTDAHRIGTDAVRLLIERINHAEAAVESVIIPQQFVDHGTA